MSDNLERIAVALERIAAALEPIAEEVELEKLNRRGIKRFKIPKVTVDDLVP